MAKEEEQSQPAWNPTTRHRLVAHVAERNNDRNVVRLPLRSIFAVAAAASIAVITVLVLFSDRLSTTVVHPTNVTLEGQLFTSNGETHQRSFEGEVGELLTAPPDSRLLVKLGADTIGIDSNSQVKIVRRTKEETRLALIRGQMACHVEKRKPGDHFVVEAMKREVIVKGTRFSVKMSPELLTVAVVDGAVEATGHDGEYLRIEKGNSLRLEKGRAPLRSDVDSGESDKIHWLLGQSSKWKIPPETPNDSAHEREGETVLPDDGSSRPKVNQRSGKAKPRDDSNDGLAAWREMILQGRLQEAEQGLITHLKEKPGDVEGWQLLATCQRKSERWAQSVTSYRKVMALGTTTQANEARLRAGIVLQDKLGRHEEAISLLREYIANAASSNPLRADAKLRLAESLLETGQKAEAARILDEIAEQDGQTPASDRARRILERVR
jgi:hypothetical protein